MQMLYWYHLKNQNRTIHQFFVEHPTTKSIQSLFSLIFTKTSYQSKIRLESNLLINQRKSMECL